MKGMSATEAKNKFGQVLEMVKSESVAIEKKGRPVAVVLSFAEYHRLTELEDRYWGERAVTALKGGFVAEGAIQQWLKKKRVPGSAKGQIIAISPDFDETPEDFIKAATASLSDPRPSTIVDSPEDAEAVAKSWTHED